MADEQKGEQGSAAAGQKGIWKVLLIVAVVLVIIFGGYFGLAAILRIANKGLESPTASPTAATQKGGKFDQALVGTWTSDCLVPDQDSPWAEKHQFVINADGTAVHTRWSSEDHSCNPQGYPGTLTDNYKMTVVKAATSGTLGQINLLDTGKNATFYDVYQVNGNTLKFGHGFRNDLAYPSTQGTSEADRITALNDYIVYRK